MSGQVPSLLTLALERREPECRLRSVGSVPPATLRPLDLGNIIPLDVQLPFIDYVARAALARSGAEPADLLLDLRTPDLWLSVDMVPDVGGEVKELLEHASAGGCLVTSLSSGAGYGRTGLAAGVERLSGTASKQDLRVLALPRDLWLRQQAFFGFLRGTSSISSWQGVLGIGHPRAGDSHRPLVSSVGDAVGGAVAAVVPGLNAGSAWLALGPSIQQLCETAVAWTFTVGAPGYQPGQWAVQLALNTRDFSWQGVTILDLSSFFLRIPASQLPSLVKSLMGIAVQRCRQPWQMASAAGLILCPCDVMSTQAPLQVTVADVKVAVPWTCLLQPVAGEPGMCLLRVHAAPAGENPSVGLSLFDQRIVAFDHDASKVGLCKADAAALRALSVPQLATSQASSGAGPFPGSALASVDYGESVAPLSHAVAAAKEASTTRGPFLEGNQSTTIAWLVIGIALCPMLLFYLSVMVRRCCCRSSRMRELGWAVCGDDIDSGNESTGSGL